MAQKKMDEYLPVEVTIELNLTPAKITIRGTTSDRQNEDRFLRPLQSAIQALMACKAEIKEAMAEFMPTLPSPKAAVREQLEARPLERGAVGILEFTEEEVKFPPEAIERLTGEEAVALLLYEFGKPMKPALISQLINKGFKKLSDNVIRAYLTAKGGQYRLPRYVIKEADGYRLTAQGKGWVEKEVIAKLRG